MGTFFGGRTITRVVDIDQDVVSGSPATTTLFTSLVDEVGILYLSYEASASLQITVNACEVLNIPSGGGVIEIPFGTTMPIQTITVAGTYRFRGFAECFTTV